MKNPKHKSHDICNKRLIAEHGRGFCCLCVPHDDCGLNYPKTEVIYTIPNHHPKPETEDLTTGTDRSDGSIPDTTAPANQAMNGVSGVPGIGTVEPETEDWEKEIIDKYTAAFGTEFGLWHEFGWWLNEIRELRTQISKAKKEAVEKVEALLASTHTDPRFDDPYFKGYTQIGTYEIALRDVLQSLKKGE